MAFKNIGLFQFVASASSEGPEGQDPALPFKAAFTNIPSSSSPSVSPTPVLNPKKFKCFTLLPTSVIDIRSQYVLSSQIMESLMVRKKQEW